ncbi:MAG: trypsin-like peptidase domain-containing protein [Erysipelotrichaceae bacterium]|nr:trypsin-like peptidase domain-containing protein [Erysipelotrichaceae bacterium]
MDEKNFNEEINEESNLNDETNLSEESYLKDEKTYSGNVYTVYPPEKKEKNRHVPMILWLVFSLLLCMGSSFLTARYVMNKMQKDNSGSTVIYEAVPTDTVVYQSSDLSGIVSEIENSVVEVYTESVKYNTFFGEYVTSGAGSGVICSKDGYIITNNHVIEDAKSIRVTLHDGTDYSAVLIGTDSITDLAVIKIDAQGLTPATLGSDSTVKVGETCIAIGNPLGTLGGTVTSGIVSALSRTITVDGQKMTLMQTNTTINPGNSGGGLFDVSGNLIGIVNAKYSSSDIEGIGFAIPVDVVKEITQELITNGKVTGRAYLGIKIVNIDSERAKSYYGMPQYGVLVRSVELQSTVSSGLQTKDLIIGMDDDEIRSYDDLQDALLKRKAGDKVTLKIIRDNQEKELSVVLAERP